MRIDKKQRDFAAKPTPTFYAIGCCSCCCLMWLGGLVGAVVGTAKTKHHLAIFGENPESKALLGYARRWYWFHLIVSSVLLLLAPLLLMHLTSPSSHYSSHDKIVAWIIFVGLAPTINCLIATVFTGMQIRKKISNSELRDHIDNRNWKIVGVSLIGYVVGYTVVSMVGLPPLLIFWLT